MHGHDTPTRNVFTLHRSRELPQLELRAAGYHAVLACQPGWNGVAVLAKERPAIVSRELPGAGAHGARFVVAKVAGLELASIYVPNGKTVNHPDYQMKLAWLDCLAGHVEERRGNQEGRGTPLVVAGDLNVCPTDLDSFGGSRFKGRNLHTDAERALLERLSRAGLVDLFRAKYPDAPGDSWWDCRAGSFHRQEGMRIDLLLASSAVAERVEDVYVDCEYRKKGKASGPIPSDHAPVVAVLA